MRAADVIRAAAVALGTAAACAPDAPSDPADDWHSMADAGITVEYHAVDAALAPALLAHALAGRAAAAEFFDAPVPGPFTVRVYPDRARMEPDWRRIFDAPGFRFECWMIANASPDVVLLLSPGAWSREACGHDGEDAAHVRRVVGHEIIHVLHRRSNPEPGLPRMQPSWWLVEGLATFGSGQLDGSMRAAAAAALRDAPPSELEQVWRGAAAYALAASLVSYIDAVRGRAALRELMVAGDEAEILAQLGWSEGGLLDGWRAWALAAAAPALTRPHARKILPVHPR